MIIKTLEGQIHKVNIEEVYIKPFYLKNKIHCYALCSNEDNNEVVLAEYTDRTIAGHMLHLLIHCSALDVPHEILPYVSLQEDLLLSASFKLRKAKEKFKKEQEWE
ncbi:hypothetical protein [Clostridium botulinum]|uniref:hypothetical protein n=1 Tax=Clostridium botulinum TaxID=1491 RepID=UPI0004CFECB5|nr:hypothetical protein [Clostridium botulinum]AXG97796.1 hypothetical protein AGE31_19600 [Clostridium botulinum]MBY6773557.1 hypothetical protein [Clostridium botulinum]MBY6886024.1 hypothetical protein [Clostridium botulinum]